MKQSHVFHRSNVETYPTAVKGDGIYIVDDSGNSYLDGCCGAAVSCLGHSNQEVRDAMTQQINDIAFAHTGFFTTEPLEQLGDWLAEQAPGDLNRTYFLSGGSEAVETAIKLARQYWTEKNEPNRKYMIARLQSYHGNTLGALSAGGNMWRRAQFEPILVNMEHISPCYEYRLKEEGESSFDFGQRVANELEETIQKLGAENVIGFMAEPVVGATLGCVTAVEGYFKRIKEICDQYNILLILDEVMCGMGRTGSLFACEQEEIVPDIITVAKGLGGGYQPIGATIVSENIYNTITEGTGFFQHGHTYIGHATACKAALTVQQIIQRDNLLDNVKQQEQFLQSRLHEIFSDHPNVGDIRGRGLFYGLELVQDKTTKQPFDPSLKIHARIKKTAMEHGLMCYAMGGTIDGKQGNHIMFAPPFIISQDQIDEMLTKFSKSLELVVANL